MKNILIIIGILVLVGAVVSATTLMAPQPIAEVDAGVTTFSSEEDFKAYLQEAQISGYFGFAS